MSAIGLDLQRFIKAQDSFGVYENALAEVRSGCKRGHWIWFVFPQIAGLGKSSTSRFYAIQSLAEAKAYWEDELSKADLWRLQLPCLNRMGLHKASLAGWMP